MPAVPLVGGGLDIREGDPRLPSQVDVLGEHEAGRVLRDFPEQLGLVLARNPSHSSLALAQCVRASTHTCRSWGSS